MYFTDQNYGSHLYYIYCIQIVQILKITFDAGETLRNYSWRKEKLKQYKFDFGNQKYPDMIIFLEIRID